MKKTFLLLIVLTLINNNTFACLQRLHQHLSDGHVYGLKASGETPSGHHLIRDSNEGFDERIQSFDSLYRSTKKINYLQDKALLQIISKQYYNAISTYLEIEKINPNLYETAANIGTTYELVGDNIKALQWINKAIAIDSSSHDYSEWIHANILEAKIKGFSTFTSLALIETHFGYESIPISKLSEEKLMKLYNEIKFQLNERMTFIKPKDAIIAQLLFDMGNIAYLLKKEKAVNRLFDMAYEYGYPVKKQLIIPLDISFISNNKEAIMKFRQELKNEKSILFKKVNYAVLSIPNRNNWVVKFFCGLMFVSATIVAGAVVLYKMNKRC